MNVHKFLGVFVAASLLLGASRADAACRESLSWSEMQGRNAWAEKWGYLLPGEASQLSDMGIYIEFVTGCYRSYTSCSPLVPVTSAGSYVSGLVTSEYCAADCYTPAQELLFEGKYVGIEEAARAERASVTTLAAGSTRDEPLFAEQSVRTFTSSPVVGVIFVLEGEDGERLEVTGPHPVVRADGTIVEARTLKAGDELASADGKPVRLARVGTYTYEGAVWNVVLASLEKADNIVVAEGILAGSMLFNNARAYDKFRLSLRDKVDAAEILAKR